MTRRDLLISIIQALLLALFPWLRSDRGILAARQLAEDIFPILDYGDWTSHACWHLVRGYTMKWVGPKEQP